MMKRLMILVVLSWLCFQSVQAEDVLIEVLPLLQTNTVQTKQQAIETLAKSTDANRAQYLQVLMNGELYLHSNGTLAIVKDSQVLDPKTNQVLPLPSSEFKKITTTNNLRSQIRKALEQLNLTDANPTVRLQAATNLLSTITPDIAASWQQLLTTETDPTVKNALQLGIDLAALNAPEKSARLQAIQLLSGNLAPEVRKRLQVLTTDSDAEIAQASQRSLKTINDKIELYSYGETLFFGVSLGSILVLAAIGLAITFGVMGVINMAHGELIMLGAYTTYFIQQLMPSFIDYSLILAIPAAFIVSGLMGILIERTVIRHLYGRPLETLLATFGISLILQQLVRTVVSPQNVPVSNPSWMSGSLEINSVLSLTYNRLYIIVFCLIVFAVLFMVLKKTNLGLQVRAVSQNRAMARAMGVRSARVDALTFGLGSGIAGVAGVALSQITNVGPNLGQSYIIDSFMVVVFGGVGNLWGTLVAGLSLGVVNKVLEPWAGAVLAKILVLVFIILFIQKRPRGLFPQKGRAAGD
jgi:urea transport system permease protein